MTLRRDAPGRRRGMTLPEVAMAVAIGGTMAVVIAALFRAGLTSYQYSMRQTFFLAGIRKALQGDGRRAGMGRGSMNAQASGGLAATDLQLLSSDAPAVDYYVSGDTLFRRQLGIAQPLAPNITGLSVAYYQMNSGLIATSTDAASAQLLTFTATFQGSALQKSYAVFSGARLRNHP